MLAGALALGACTPKVAQRGAMPDIDVVASIVPNKTTKADVERMLGSPSSVNMFGQETWMYIGETTQQVAFLEREVEERSVLVIRFDEQGTVADISSHGLAESRQVEPVERKTPTVGKEITLIEQLMGNLNRLGNIGGGNNN